jgi:hypothetical protein
MFIGVFHNDGYSKLRASEATSNQKISMVGVGSCVLRTAAMLNEILTGKASNEQPKLAPEPPPRPPPAPVAYQDSYAAESRLALALAEADLRRERSHARIRRAVLIVICGTIVAFIKFQMRRQQQEETAAESPYFSEHYYDPYVAKTREYAEHMCFCEDLKCAREVQREYTVWSRSTTDRPQHDEAADLAHVELEHLGDCLAKHER